MSSYPKPNLTFGIPATFNKNDFPQSDNCDCSDGYIQTVYNPSSAINIFYNSGNTTPVYLNTSISIPSGTWLVNYSAIINLYSNHTTLIFLSTSSNPSTALANRVINSQTFHRTNNTSPTTSDYRTATNTFILTIPSTTTYYLYGVCTISGTPANTVLYSNSLSGLTTDPDVAIFITAIPVDVK